jgi:hypothetical protein
MRNFILLFSAIATIIIFTSTNYSTESIHTTMNTSGSSPGFAGDPASGNNTCRNCHSGPAAVQETGWITSTVPASGYVPGNTYTITASVSAPGHSKFGFEISPQNPSGIFLGTMSNTSSETKFAGGNTNYVTHQSTSTSGNGSRSWSFDWTAPTTAGQGDVTFYAAFNITNSNGSTSGDTVKISQLTLSESTTTSTDEISDRTISIAPNPIQYQGSIRTNKAFENASIHIYALNGALVRSISNINGNVMSLDRGLLSSGLYYLHIEEDNKLIHKQLVSFGI